MIKFKKIFLLSCILFSQQSFAESSINWEKEAWLTGMDFVQVKKLNEHLPNLKAEELFSKTQLKSGFNQFDSLCPKLNPLTEPNLSFPIIKYCAENGSKQHWIALAIYEARQDGKDNKWGHDINAKRYMKIAADAGFPKAMYSYAFALVEGYGESGESTKKDKKEAEELYNKLDALGFNTTKEKAYLKEKAIKDDVALQKSNNQNNRITYDEAWEIAEQLRKNSQIRIK